MGERPILFSGPMVRAILAGAKSQTRRVLAPRHHWHMGERDDGGRWPFFDPYVYAEPEPIEVPCPYGAAGDRLWVRETWLQLRPEHWPAAHGTAPEGARGAWERGVVYRASVPEDPSGDGERARRDYGYVYRPSIYMPRWASRLTLEVTDVRVERLHEITEVDAIDEGVTPAAVGDVTAWAAYRLLWDAINGARPGCSWDENPWVWAVTFRRVPT